MAVEDGHANDSAHKMKVRQVFLEKKKRKKKKKKKRWFHIWFYY